MAETSNTTRRALLKGAPAAAIAASTVMPAGAEPATDAAERARMLAVIEQLEASRKWEPSSVTAAKAFAAWQMRRAMGLDMPDPRRAQMHVDYQRHNFETYQRCAQYERDRSAGQAAGISPFEEALA